MCVPIQIQMASACKRARREAGACIARKKREDKVKDAGVYLV